MRRIRLLGVMLEEDKPWIISLYSDGTLIKNRSRGLVEKGHYLK